MESGSDKDQVSTPNMSIVLGPSKPAVNERITECTNTPTTPELVPVPGDDAVVPLELNGSKVGKGVSHSHAPCRASGKISK